MLISLILNGWVSLLAVAQPIKSTTPVVIDVRTAYEFQQGHVEGSRNLDIYSSQFASEIKKLDPKKEYYLYCRSGARANDALRVFHQHGIHNVKNLGTLQNALRTLHKKCQGC